MRQISREMFRRVEVRDRGDVISGLSLLGCRFVDCSIGHTEASSRRLTIHDSHLKDCFADRCHLGPIILDDVTIDGFDNNDLQIVNACAFRHVTFRGRIRRVNVSWECISAAPKFAANINRLNREFHANVDWALDISEAEFDDTVVRLDVPHQLIRLDRSRQIIVLRRSITAESLMRIKPMLDPVVASRLDALVRFDPEDGFAIVGSSEDEAESVRVLRNEGLATLDGVHQ